jgi:hypothetical protein
MRLGGKADLLEPFPAKPKGMHRWKFQRLRARAEAAMYRSNRALQPRDATGANEETHNGPRSQGADLHDHSWD